MAKKFSSVVVGNEEDALTSAVSPVQEMSPERPAEAPPPPPSRTVPVVQARPAVQGKQVIDVRREGPEVANGVFRLNRYVDGADYVDALNSRYIMCIGRNMHDGRIEASLDARYYGDANWECLFLR